MKEINLNPGYGLDAFPMSKRFGSHNGGPTMPADSAHARIDMQRVNKNQNNETEEEDSEEIISEISAANLDAISGVAKSALFSIPVFGDLFAFGKFLITIAKMRTYSKKFAATLSELSGVDVGGDVLEPEGTMTSDDQLDAALSEAVNRLSDIVSYEASHSELDVTMKDIYDNPNQPWEWEYISKNPNLTIDFINEHINASWDWSEIFNHKFIKDKKEFMEKNIMSAF